MSRDSGQVSQNCDNFISSRSSTRLHAPPGGGSSMGSLIFGGSEPEETRKGGRRLYGQGQQAPAVEEPQTSSKAYGVKAVQEEARPERIQLEKPAMDNQPRQTSSSNAFSNGSSQNTGNVLTDRPTTRVHAPPGGKSSFTLG